MAKHFQHILRAWCLLRLPLLHGIETGIVGGELDDAESLIHKSVAAHISAERNVARSAEARARGSPKKHKHGAKADTGHLDRGREDWMRRNATCEAILAGEIPVERELFPYEWHEFGEKAMCNLPRKLTGFAEKVPKVPKSFVEKLKELSHAKRHQFNFIGSMDFMHPSRKEQRLWIFPFAKEHFSDGDLLRLTDVPDRGAYDPQGPYDVSLEPRGNQTDEHNPYFDPFYFGTLAASNFTLCPSGDHGWSVRVWEAAAAGSICVIRSLAQDVNANTLLCRIPFKFYSEGSSLRYSQEVADHNYRMFIKYLTFLEGDNVPPEGCNGKVVE